MITPDISEISAIFSDRSRAIMLMELLGGARTTGELAKVSNIKPQTATYHLSRMVDKNLIVKNRLGKNSYYRIENDEVAKILESLMQLSKDPKITSLKESVRSEQIRFARLCYNHIAGKLGVILFEKFQELGYVETMGTSVFLTDKGSIELKEYGFEFKDGRYIGELCKDWSEKSNHISGDIGNMIYENLLRLEVIEKDKDSRKIILREEGVKFLKDKFNIEV